MIYHQLRADLASFGESCRVKANASHIAIISTETAKGFSGSPASTIFVAKRNSEPYLAEHANWLKIRNPKYSQWVGHEELFERERREEPSFQHWAERALACEGVQLEYT